MSTGKEYDGIENTWLMTDDVTQVMRYNMVLHDAMWSGVVFHDIVYCLSHFIELPRIEFHLIELR